jgi:hypothetical protein
MFKHNVMIRRVTATCAVMIEIDVHRIATARAIRRQYPEYRAPEDDGRRTLVRLVDDTPRTVVDYVRGEAADSLAERAEEYGQEPLTRAEKRDLDFTEVSVPFARSVKAIGLGKGVSNWRDYVDPTLTVDEHRGVFEAAAGDEAGYGRSYDDRREQARREQRAVAAERGQLADSAREAAIVDLDAEAAEFVRGGPGFEFTFSRDDRGVYVPGGGVSTDAAERRHRARPDRAQRVDEREAAPLTTDPYEWANDPDEYDLPGIDTVRPARVHDRRSRRARRVDEARVATIADSPEQWAGAPDRYDFPGIDTPPEGRRGR